MAASVYPIQTRRYVHARWETAPDLLAEEEPLEIRIEYGTLNDRRNKSLAVTMRTPGHDFELALGFLYSEGLIRTPADIHSIRYCSDTRTEEEKENIVRVFLAPECEVNLSSTERNFYMTSSCGLCGKASLEALQKQCPETPFPENDWHVSPEWLTTLPESARQAQSVFDHTGGLHACALFQPEGKLILIREDIGRHNALDKIIGASFMSPDIDLKRSVLFLSGRAGFELIQKAAMTGIRFVAAVGAPSSLAARLAQAMGITLVGFLRDQRFNIYSGEKRISS